MKFNTIERPKLISLAVALFCFSIVANVFKQQIIVLQDRQGFLMSDPILNILGPWDLNLPIFLLTYIPIVFGLLYVIRDSKKCIALIYSYCLLQIFRLSCIYLVPLEPPAGMIFLNDPISDHLVFGTIITKDLFFSGHVSAIILFSFYFNSRKIRWLYRAIALADAFCLMGQHVHYFIDVLSAPLFAFISYLIIKKINEEYFTKPHRSACFEKML